MLLGGCFAFAASRSLRLSRVSASFGGTLHAPFIHLLNNPPQQVEDEILQGNLSVETLTMATTADFGTAARLAGDSHGAVTPAALLPVSDKKAARKQNDRIRA